MHVEGIGDVETRYPFCGEMIQKGARIVDSKCELTVHMFTIVNNQVIAEDESGTQFINIDEDLTEVIWSQLSITDLRESVKASIYDQAAIDDAMKQVFDTDEYKAILKTGAKLISSKLQLKRGVLRFEYDTDKSYAVYPTGVIRGESLDSRNLGLRQGKFDTKGVKISVKPIETYKNLLKRLSVIISRRERNQGLKRERKEKLNSNVISLGELDLPSVYNTDLDLSKWMRLESLIGGPKVVKGRMQLYDCINLKSLEGAPKQVYKTFNIDRCTSITSLEGGPKEVHELRISETKIRDLKGCPELRNRDKGSTHTGGIAGFDMPNLISLEGLPKKASSVSFTMTHSSEVSLKGIGVDYLLECNYFSLTAKKVVNALGLVLVKSSYHSPNSDYSTFKFPGGDIIWRYFGKGQDALIDCQHELIGAGFDEVAQL